MKRSKRMKRLAVLFGIFVVACGITIGVVKYEEKKEQIKNSDEIILQISPETVTALSWENETESLAFHKDGTWLYDADEAFPVDEDAVNELLSLFEEFGVSFVIDDVEDFSQYGLDDPVCTIHITTTEQLEDVKTAEELAAEEMETDEAEGGENSETDEEPQADEPASSAAAEDETSEVGETSSPKLKRLQAQKKALQVPEIAVRKMTSFLKKPIRIKPLKRKRKLMRIRLQLAIPMKSVWVISASWILSAMFPLVTAKFIWSQMTLSTYMMQASAT